MRYDVEYTDTFGGEANYCWCKRLSIEAEANITDLALLRRAKKALGLNGLRGRTSYHGELIEFRPYRCCTVMFITPRY